MISHKQFMQSERKDRKVLKGKLVGILRNHYTGSEWYAKLNAQRILDLLKRDGVIV